MANRELDVGWLRLFHALGRLGNLTRVAEVSGLSQPAVSYQLRRIEESLGVPLVKRLHRGAELTPEGRLLHDAVHESLELIDGAVKAIRRRGRQQAIRIHTDFGFASYWLMPRIAEFRRMEPEIEVHVVASQGLGSEEATDADLRILFGEKRNFPAGAIQLTREKVVPVCTPAYLARHAPLDTAAAISAQPLIHLQGDAESRWFSWQTWLKQFGAERRPATGELTLNTYNLVVQAALAEQGMALGWHGLIDDLLKSGLLVAAGPAQQRPDHGYWLISSSTEDPLIDKLVEWLLAENHAN